MASTLPSNTSHAVGSALQVVLASLFAAQDAIPHCVNSFELFGFDIMIDRCGMCGGRKAFKLVARRVGPSLFRRRVCDASFTLKCGRFELKALLPSAMQQLPQGVGHQRQIVAASVQGHTLCSATAPPLCCPSLPHPHAPLLCRPLFPSPPTLSALPHPHLCLATVPSRRGSLKSTRHLRCPWTRPWIARSSRE